MTRNSLDLVHLDGGNLSNTAWLCLCFVNYCNRFHFLLRPMSSLPPSSFARQEFGSEVDPHERLVYQILLHRPGVFVGLFFTACVIVSSCPGG